MPTRIRHKAFETNSSAVHTLTLTPDDLEFIDVAVLENVPEQERLPLDADGKLRIPVSYFGRGGGEQYNDLYTKAVYLMTFVATFRGLDSWYADNWSRFGIIVDGFGPVPIEHCQPAVVRRMATQAFALAAGCHPDDVVFPDVEGAWDDAEGLTRWKTRWPDDFDKPVVINATGYDDYEYSEEYIGFNHQANLDPLGVFVNQQTLNLWLLSPNSFLELSADG